MSVEETIHDLWSRHQPLADLVPAARVATGNVFAPETAYPLARINRQSVIRVWTANSNVERTTYGLLVDFYGDIEQLDVLYAASRALRNLLHRAEFDCGLDGYCTKANRVSENTSQTAGGLWHLWCEYELHLLESLAPVLTNL